MTDIGNPNAVSRRRLLRLGAVAAGAAVAGAALPGGAHAETDAVIVKKTTKTKSEYREAVTGPTCSSCWHFRGAAGCRVVEGVSHENGRSALYVSRLRMA
jgi:anaerobic selenocysteine-containing dehydrogenase